VVIRERVLPPEWEEKEAQDEEEEIDDEIRRAKMPYHPVVLPVFRQQLH